MIGHRNPSWDFQEWISGKGHRPDLEMNFPKAPRGYLKQTLAGMQPNYELVPPPRSILVLPCEPRLIRVILLMIVDGILRISVDETLFDRRLLNQGV